MNTRPHRSTLKHARGLALVELVVVLLILVLIAGTAITATQDIVEGTFYDTTHTTLENIEEAILGPYAPPTAHDDTLLSGFVADVGRLPRMISADPEIALAELWVLPVGVAPFAIQSPPGDCELHIPGGWRGPYLHMGFGVTRLLDGWGHPFHVFGLDGEPAELGDEPCRIASLGADATDGVTDADPDIAIMRSNGADVLRRHLASLVVRLEPLLESDITTNVLVRIYAPSPTDGVVRMIYQERLGGTGAESPEDTIPVSHEFTNVPVGPRVVRAYDWPYDDFDVPSSTDLTQLRPRSAPATVLLVSGGVPEVVLKIGAPMPPCVR